MLFAYSKMWLSDEIMASDLPEDPWIGTALARYFPALLREKFGAYIPRHPLKREIVATHVLNSMVNRVGSTFVHRLSERTGARPAQVVRAYLAAREVFGDVAVWQQVEALDNKVADAVQSEMLIEEGWLTARATTWFLRSRRLAEPLEQTFRRFIPAVQALRARLEPQAAASPQAAAWIAAGVPPPLALRVASADQLIAALDVAEVAEAVQRNFDEVSEVHVGIGTRLGLSRLRQQIDALPSDSHWQAWPRPRSATTSPGCSARSPRTCCSKARAALPSCWRPGRRATRPRSSARSGCSPSWPTPREAPTWRCSRWRCGSCATSASRERRGSVPRRWPCDRATPAGSAARPVAVPAPLFHFGCFAQFLIVHCEDGIAPVQAYLASVNQRLLPVDQEWQRSRVELPLADEEPPGGDRPQHHDARDTDRPVLVPSRCPRPVQNRSASENASRLAAIEGAGQEHR